MARPKKNTKEVNKEAGAIRKKNNIKVSDLITNDILVPPKYLTDIAKAKWKELAPEFLERKLMTKLDITALETLCIQYATAIECYHAMLEMSTDGSITGYIRGRNSQEMGEYNAYFKSITACNKILLEFGMTPASRSRVPEPQVAEEKDAITAMIEKNAKK